MIKIYTESINWNYLASRGCRRGYDNVLNAGNNLLLPAFVCSYVKYVIVHIGGSDVCILSKMNKLIQFNQMILLLVMYISVTNGIHSFHLFYNVL